MFDYVNVINVFCFISQMDLSLRLKRPFADDFELCSVLDPTLCYNSNVCEKLKKHKYRICPTFPVSTYETTLGFFPNP